MPVKKIAVALVIILVAVGGFAAGLILLRERQDLREKASTPTGTTEVSISPETGSYEIGESIETTIYFNPAGIAISGVAVRLMYPFSGGTPEVSVENIEINSTLLATGDWTCPTQDSTQQGESVIIDIACANTSASGFSASENTLLANVNLKVNRPPAVNPITLRFDAASSVITRKTDNQDILLIPSSTGVYTIGEAEVTPTSPPEATLTPTGTLVATRTPTPTSRLTVTPTSTISATPTVTSKGGEELPDAGISYPTIMGIVIGILMIGGALILIL
ncbi:hypothetical protein A2686_02805 [Candidatus Woesebacteria bacterium RIFCSPHIGHO2_01_FULL_38_10]|uniref:Cohesin domain-containing protein n=1 Tax=Candidatus Woesebacteria bacterium RIFCSPLOWO2_01_FULL_39_10b TaxID=1802517 RepID=A0A1F8B8X5_9BACT|nr:MAG: hypothetical protein A2686_02805 [Candidatus Woesebacteria bacterium RIFCSPHIGHO2_01_FULL_38_10]OGM60492.1 MAG: hypothetical protein A2892_00500 [Candidatus Woesebacteria bacterium RIFCSPLOWO2_01_FULL_39_10b]